MGNSITEREGAFYMNTKGSVQRTFVYLRQQEGGGRESGYVRAEAQERNVRLNLVVQGFDARAQPYAFGVTEEDIVPIGRVLLDARGQGGVSAQVDSGEFGRMQLMIVAYMRGGETVIPLAGTVGRNGQTAWLRVRQQVTQQLQPQKTAEEPQPEEKTVQREAPVQQGETFETAERKLRTPLPREKRVELPPILRNAYWPQKLWPLHDLFERFEEVQPFGPKEDSAYIRVPLEGKFGSVGHYLVGAKVQGGWVEAIGYLIPGEREMPVRGLEEAQWSDGYWQMWQWAETE